MWTDRGLTQLICKAGTLNQSRLKAGGSQAISAASWESVALQGAHSRVFLTPREPED